MPLKPKKRRSRQPDPLASPAEVRRICEILRHQFPALIPKSDNQLHTMLNAVRHCETHPIKENKRGRPSRWLRDDLLTVGRELKAILARETSGRISLSSFIGVYLRILQFPAEISHSLELNQINLQEAMLVARLTAPRLGQSQRQTEQLRRQIIAAHLQTKGSQNSLRLRVQAILNPEIEVVSSQTMAKTVQRVDELLEIDPDDLRHLFYEEIRNLFYAMKDIDPEEINETDIENFSAASDQLFNVLQGIRRRRKTAKQTDLRLL